MEEQNVTYEILTELFTHNQNLQLSERVLKRLEPKFQEIKWKKKIDESKLGLHIIEEPSPELFQEMEERIKNQYGFAFDHKLFNKVVCMNSLKFLHLLNNMFLSF